MALTKNRQNRIFSHSDRKYITHISVNGHKSFFSDDERCSSRFDTIAAFGTQWTKRFVQLQNSFLFLQMWKQSSNQSMGNSLVNDANLFGQRNSISKIHLLLLSDRMWEMGRKTAAVS